MVYVVMFPCNEVLRHKLNIVCEIRDIDTSIYVKRALNEILERDININAKTKDYVTSRIKEECARIGWATMDGNIAYQNPNKDPCEIYDAKKELTIRHSSSRTPFDDFFTCPKCEVEINLGDDKCYKCGQEIKWEEVTD